MIDRLLVCKLFDWLIVIRWRHYRILLEHGALGFFLSQFEDYNYVSFLPFDQTDEESISDILLTIDNSIQYGEDLEHKEMPVRDAGRQLFFL